jgi:hypothetical protein
MTSPAAEGQLIARRARNVVAQTILVVSMSALDPGPTIGQLIDLLEPLNDLAHAWPTN